MQKIKISELKPHPRNNEFFDDIAGEKWTEFLDSVKSRGVIEPIVITQDYTIVSGHQRVRACKELGIDEVFCDVHIYNTEDEVLQDLLETNLKQRGTVGGSAKKIGLRLKELERLYGIKNGGDRKSDKISECQIDKLMTQEDLAEKLGMTVSDIQRYKKLSTISPELDELLTTGTVTKSTVLSILKQLSENEQEQLISELDIAEKYTQKEVQKYIDEIKRLKNNPPKPSDYDSTKTALSNYKSENSFLCRENDRIGKENRKLKNEIENIKKSEPVEQYNKKMQNDTIFFCSKVADFIEKVGGYVWLSEHLNELPDYERKSYKHAVQTIYDWADILLEKIIDIDDQTDTTDENISIADFAELIDTDEQTAACILMESIPNPYANNFSEDNIEKFMSWYKANSVDKSVFDTCLDAKDLIDNSEKTEYTKEDMPILAGLYSEYVPKICTAETFENWLNDLPDDIEADGVYYSSYRKNDNTSIGTVNSKQRLLRNNINNYLYFQFKEDTNTNQKKNIA